MIILLIGPVGSGKSTASEMFKNKGCKIIDADILSRKIMLPGTQAYNDIVKFFGNDVLYENGSINRKKLANIVFNDVKKLRKLEKYTHNRIFNVIKNEIDYSIKKYSTNIVVELPLFQLSREKLEPDKVLGIISEKSLRKERLLTRPGIDDSLADKIIENQPSNMEYIKYSDKTIYNDSSIEIFKKEIENYYNNNIL